MRSAVWWMMLVLGASSGGGVAAQQGVPWDQVDEIIVRRSLDLIQVDREDYARRKDGADASAGSTRLRVAELDDRLDQMKAAISAADQKVKAARDTKQEAEKVVAESEKKRLERQRSVVEKRRELWDARYEEARAEAEHADRESRAFELEYGLERLRQDGSTATALADLEKKALEARVAAARARESATGRGVRVAERRLSLFEAQQQLLRER